MNQSITITGIDEAIVNWISQEAARRGIGFQEMVLQLIYTGVGIERETPPIPIYHDLDSLAGTWSDQEANEFLEAISEFNRVDEKLWQ
jgi:hypothetical protein